MADLLSYVGTDGQIPGEQVGLLPEGHAPLPSIMVKQVTAARTAVLAGWTAPAGGDDGANGDGDDPTDPPGAPPGGGGGVPPVTVGPAPGTPDPSGSTTVEPKPPAGDLGPTMLSVGEQASGKRMVMLPMLGIIALLALAAGPVLLWMSRTGRGPQWLRQ